MQITLLDINPVMCKEWEKEFQHCNDVKIVNDNIFDYATKLREESQIDFAIVSPANSFGMMDGGYDLGITNFYKSIGINIIKRVQDKILEYHLGEQPIATVLSLNMYLEGFTDMPNLLHIPTMRVPMSIRFSNIPYMCMKELLLYLDYGNNDEDIIGFYDEIIVPAFGGGCGGVDFNIISKQMKLAYDRCKRRQSIDLSDWNKIDNEIRKSQGY